MKHENHLCLLCRWLFIFSGFFWLAGIHLHAASAAETISQYNSRVWRFEEGLPQNSVQALIQTRDGYLWAGTRKGLARFDGITFTVFHTGNTPGLKNDSVTALCEGRDGSLWIGTEDGLCRLHQGKIFHLDIPSGPDGNVIRGLFESKDGSLWIGSRKGLSRFKDGKFESFKHQEVFAQTAVRAMLEDRQESLWIAAETALYRLRGDKIVSYMDTPGLAGCSTRVLAEDPEGNLWIGSNNGLSRLKNDECTLFSKNDGLSDNFVLALYVDSAGTLWIGTAGGLQNRAGGKFLIETTQTGEAHDWVNAILEDREGNLWVGTKDGLHRLQARRFTMLTRQQGLTHNNIMSVCEDRSGAIWVATWGGGLNRWQDGKVTAYTSATESFWHDLVLSLHEDREGILWFGMDYNGGLYRVQDGKFPRYGNDEGLDNAAIRVIYHDRQNRLWAGSSKSLQLLKDGKFIRFTTEEGLAGNTVRAICESHKGALWIGTDGGLSRFQDGAFANFTTRQGLSHNTVLALHEDAEETLWIGTAGGGLNRLRKNKFTFCKSEHGLFSDEIFEILEDDFGQLWMSSLIGVFRVSKKELNDFADGKVSRIHCISYGQADGMASVQCNGVAKPAGWKTKDGRLCFATTRGVAIVDPRLSMKGNDFVPPVIIEQVIADKKSIAANGSESGNFNLPTFSLSHLFVPPGRGELEFHYTALSFQAPEKNQFKYKLEGVDPEWVNAGARRVAYYNNIKPGQYRFRVLGSNNDGVWNELGSSIKLTLQPHFWQTWWFKVATLSAMGGLLAIIHQVRTARLRELEHLRIRIAADLHDDVGASLTKIAMLTEMADRDTGETDKIKPHIKNISATSREIIQAMDEIVWTINPKNDTLDNLATYIFQYAQEFFQHTNIRCRVDMPVQLPNHSLSTDARHNLFLAFKEALNNAAKHAAATEVRVRLAVENKALSLTIADNGCGFDAAKISSTGNGLANMNERVGNIGGRFAMETKPGQGTKISMSLDLA